LYVKKNGDTSHFILWVSGTSSIFSLRILDSRFEREKQGAERKQEGAAVEPQGEEEAEEEEQVG
jgi:hypothetical protein